ncbi:MAG TPA: asparagine synthase (glutamine-hydrolyzing) [Bacteroidales bacterium]|nr:asparagine synthase (glutamine-hydrolyzing) [Bacteroidales bacterium]
MCGIAGILKIEPSAPEVTASLHKMADKLRHRGPDDEGYVCFGNNNTYVCGGKDTQQGAWDMNLSYAVQDNIETVPGGQFLGLAHRRLAVIDLSPAGHQPMCNDSKTVWVVFNGEIYNYWEIREELESKSVQFKSSSDVEVLLRAYEHWGLDFLSKLNGMWSFVLYDTESACLIGCRDRFGVKPFYYINSKRFFAFASEQKALLQLSSGVSVNPAAVFDYLMHSRVERTEDGLYTDIRELLPSHYMIYDLNTNQMEITRYYNLEYNTSSGRFDTADSQKIIHQVKEKIERAVTLRLRSDVNVGFCLSGGIDSSSIIGVSQKINARNPLRQLSGKLHAFTADCDEKSINELHWAEQVVKKHDLNWHTCRCHAEDLFDELENIIYYQDAPLFSTSTYAQSSVMKLARENNITILMDGQGGDELFAGYVPFFISYYAGLLRRFRLYQLGAEIACMKSSPLDFNTLIRSLAKVILSGIMPHSVWHAFIKNHHKELEYLNNDLTDTAKPAAEKPDGTGRTLNSALFEYFTNGYLRHLLRWEDRCSMQYSVESRTPFADDIDLIEYVFSVPSVYKIHKGRSKFLLREAMYDVLPETIYRRSDKLGFATPQDMWLVQSEKKVKNIIHELASFDTEKFADSGKLLKNWNMIFSENGNSRLRYFVWRYVNFLLWRKINKL